jgi:hypothetical protein
MNRPQRLFAHWVYGGALAGVLLLALAPFLAKGWSSFELLVFLALPVYMIHQYEEHDQDRFRLFINAEFGAGREVLTPVDVFIANFVGVWATLGVAFALAVSGWAGAGLFAGYLLLVNAVVHIAPAVAKRRYNPGLVTGLLVFLPLGAWILAEGSPQADIIAHAVGLGLALLIHVAIIVQVKRRLGAFARAVR